MRFYRLVPSVTFFFYTISLNYKCTAAVTCAHGEVPAANYMRGFSSGFISQLLFSDLYRIYASLQVFYVALDKRAS